MQGVAPSDRMPIVYQTEIGGVTCTRELPFRILVIGDFTGRLDERPLGERETIRVDKASFGAAMAEQDLRVQAVVPNRLTEDGGELQFDLRFRSLEDFNPAALAAQMGAPRDHQLSDQLNEILHHPRVQHLERAWRGLKFLVDNVDFEQDIEIAVVNVTKDELAEDFDMSPTNTRSGLYWHVHRRGYDSSGASPLGMILGDYSFDRSPGDIDLLRKVAAIAATAHAPFVTNTSIRFFGCDSWREVATLKDLESLFESPEYDAWNRFRESADARYAGLLGPRFLLRLPYGEALPVEELEFEEDLTEHEHHLWGGSAFAFATRVADSFAKHRWVANIIGPGTGGMVDNLPRYRVQDASGSVGDFAAETKFTLRREYELSEQGLISLVDGGPRGAAFFSANSAQKPRLYGKTPEGQQAELTFRLGTMLPYTFMIARFAHYLKVIHCEYVGVYRERSALERDLHQWLVRQTPAGKPSPFALWGRKRLRDARVEIKEVPGESEFYWFRLRISPAFNYLGAPFTLSLDGKFER